MAATKQPAIKLTTVGRSAVVVLDKKTYTLTNTTKEQKETIKKLIDSFNKLPSDTKKAKLVKLLTPKETKKKEELAVTKSKIRKQKREVSKISSKETKQLEQALKTVEELTLKNSDQAKKIEELTAVVEKTNKVEQ